MKKIKDILSKTEALIYMMATGEAAYLRFHQPYDFLFFLLDLSFVFFIFSEFFLIPKLEKKSNFDLVKYEIALARIFGILGMIIIVKYVYF